MKRTIALLLSIMLLLALTACGSEKSEPVPEATAEQAVALVQGKLDSIYLGQANAEYMELMGLSEADCQAEFEANMSEQVAYFARTFGIENVTDEIGASLTKLWTEIYTKASYTVGQATRLEEVDGTVFAVDLEIRPMNIMELIENGQEAGVARYRAIYGNSDANTAEANELWASCILDLANAQLAKIDYLDAETIAVLVTYNEDGTWTISESDIYLADDLIA